MSKTKLTPKQKQFCDEYLIDLNATRAYKAIYTNVKKDETAAANGSRLLRLAKVKAYISEKQQEKQQRTEITQDMVLKELAKIGFEQSTDFSVEGIPIVDGAKHRTQSQLKALELIGKHIGMFKEKENNDERLDKLDKVLDKIGGEI